MEHDDHLADASAGEVACVLAKLLAELVNDNARGRAICADCFRAWAAEAISRP